MVKLPDRVIGLVQGYEFIKIHEQFDEETQKTYYIYEQRNTQSGHVVAFDVFTPRIRTKPEATPTPGYFLPPGEVYPNNYSFGTNSLSIGGVCGSRREDGLKRAHQAILDLKQKILNKKKT